MDETQKVEALDSMLNNEQNSIKWSFTTASGIFFLGLIISSIILYISPRSEGKPEEALSKFLSAIPVLAGTFLSGFPVKEYFSKKNKIVYYQLLQVAYKKPPVSDEIDKRFWEIMDKNLG